MDFINKDNRFSVNMLYLNNFFKKLTEVSLQAGNKLLKSSTYKEYMEPWRIAEDNSNYIEKICRIKNLINSFFLFKT